MTEVKSQMRKSASVRSPLHMIEEHVMPTEGVFRMPTSRALPHRPVFWNFVVGMLGVLLVLGVSAFAQAFGADTEYTRAFDEGRFFILGANGELIHLKDTTGLDLFRRGGGPLLWVFPDTDGLTLKYSYIQPWAKVKNDGTVELLVGEFNAHFASVNLTLFPRKWAHRAANGHLSVPQGRTILASPSQNSEANSEVKTVNQSRTSANAKWLILCANRAILSPEKGMKRPDNVLWVVPQAEGKYQLIHSGPLRSGVYLTINPDRTVVYGEEEKSKNSESKPIYWPFVAEDGKSPTIDLPPGYLDFSSYDSPFDKVIVKNRKVEFIERAGPQIP